MTFDQYGYLTPYQPIRTDLITFERVFVQEFPQLAKRQELFDRYLEYNTRLHEFLPGYVQWIGGSFVSRKANPDDFDVLTFIDNQLYDQHKLLISELQQWRMQRPKLIDGFFVRMYPNGHLLHSHSESDRIHWLFDWTQTNHHPRRNKGIIELIV